jgi:protein TonB
LGLDPSPAPSALGDGSPSLVARRLAKLHEPLRIKTMTKHRLAIAAALCILAAGVFLPVAPAKIIAGTEPVIPELDRLWSGNDPVSVQLANVSAATALNAIAAAGKLHVNMAGHEDCCLVNISLTDVPLRRALEVLAAQTGARYKVVNSDSLRVWLPEPLLPAADIEMPVLLTRVDPVYPQDARDARAVGKVILQAVIREDGTVGDVEVLAHAEGWPSMDEAAIAAVRQRTYRPAVENGRPVSIYFTIRIDFKLD